MGENVPAYCEFRECREVAERVQDDGLALCATHRKQFQRRGRLTEIQPRMSPEEAVLKAGGDWLEADADDDEAYALARKRFLSTAERWMRARGWAPGNPVRRGQHQVVVLQLSLPLTLTLTRSCEGRQAAR